MKGRRYESIDTIKGIACIAVVLIHYLFPEPFAIPIKTMSRFGVPVFFAISGYFFTSKDGKCLENSTLRKLRHILTLLLGSGVFYLVFSLVYYPWISHGWNAADYFIERVNTASLIKFLVTNDPFVFSHLWFMLALAYIYFITLLLIRDGDKIKHAAATGCILLVCYSLLQEFGGLMGIKRSLDIPGTGKAIYLFNLFVFRALPFLLIGYSMRNDQYQEFSRKVPDWVLYSTITVGMAISVLERHYTQETQYFLGNLATAWALLTIAIKNPSKGINLFSFIGRELSTYIYVVHIAVGMVLNRLAFECGVSNGIVLWVMPVLIIAGSIFVSFLCRVIKAGVMNVVHQ